MYRGNDVIAGSRRFTKRTEYAGVDKVIIDYPLDREFSDGSAEFLTSKGIRATWLPGEGIVYAKGNLKGPNDSAMRIKIDRGGSMAEVEFNPSRIFDPEGSTLCSPDLVRDAAAAVILFLASNYIVPIWYLDRWTGEIRHEGPMNWPSDWLTFVKIKRLDVARDFYSPFKDFSVSKISKIKIPGYPNVNKYTNHGVITGITWGKNNHVRHTFYNKSLKHDGDQYGGWFRFEIQQRSFRLKTQGIESLADLNEDSVFSLIWDRWEASKLFTVVRIGEGGSKLIERLQELLPPAKLLSFVGIAYLKAKEYPVRISTQTLNQYRDIADSVGFSFGNNLDEVGNLEVFLDFATGEVLAKVPDINEFAETQMNINENISIGVHK